MLESLPSLLLAQISHPSTAQNLPEKPATTIVQPKVQLKTQSPPRTAAAAIARPESLPTTITANNPTLPSPTRNLPPQPQDRTPQSAFAPAQSPPDRAIAKQKQILQEHLSDLVTKDQKSDLKSPIDRLRSAQRQEEVVALAYRYAGQRRFSQARRMLGEASMPSTIRQQIVSNIDHLEVASRTASGLTPPRSGAGAQLPQSGTTGLKTGLKMAQTAGVLPTQASSPQTAQQTLVIQVPTNGKSVPEIPPIAQSADRKWPSLLRSRRVTAGQAASQTSLVASTSNSELQTYNQTLPAPENPDPNAATVVYPLPEPAPITSKFGWRVHPVTGTRRFHSGLDLAAAQGTPIFASRRGRVKSAEALGGYGLAIVLEHDDGTQDTLYGHLSELFVRSGDEIQAGAVIGRVGTTGLSTGPHLHYELRHLTAEGWAALDPSPQIQVAEAELLKARQATTNNS